MHAGAGACAYVAGAQARTVVDGPGEKSLQEQRSLQRDQRAGSLLLGNAFQMQE